MDSHFNKTMKNSVLGKRIDADLQIDSHILFPISREHALQKSDYNVYGQDTWTAYEFYTLLKGNIPFVSRCQIIYSAQSPNIVESKSLKLYLNSFYDKQFNSIDSIKEVIKADLENIIKDDVTVIFLDIETVADSIPEHYICLESEIKSLEAFESLRFNSEQVSETLYTHLFRSLCPVTSQPDFATIIIDYTGQQVRREDVLSYIVSFSNHQGFHEQCVDLMFHYIKHYSEITQCSVQGLFTRRGGVDINPFRSSENRQSLYLSLNRQ